MLERMPRATRSTPTPPADAATTETGVSRDLAKPQKPNRTAASFVDPNTYNICFPLGGTSARASPGWLRGSRGATGAAIITDHGSAKQK